MAFKTSPIRAPCPPLLSHPPSSQFGAARLLELLAVASDLRHYFIGNRHSGETTLPPSGPRTFLSPLRTSLTWFGDFSCIRSTRPSSSQSHRPPLQVRRGTADESEHLEPFNLATIPAVAARTSSARPSTPGAPAATRTSTPKPKIAGTLGCSGELLHPLISGRKI
jgi:hypothetical protein